MEKLSIKVVLAGRTYPLTVKESEKDKIDSAVKRINSNIERLQKSYAVKDMQDLLAMTALQMATKESADGQQPVSNSSSEEDLSGIVEQLQKLSEVIDQ